MAGRIGSGSTNLVSASPFLGGLNTELSGVVDSTDFTKDELNMLIRPDGTRSRRFGIDYEEMYQFSQNTVDVSIQDLAFNCVEWSDVNKEEEAEGESTDIYLVCQIGGILIFFRNKGLPFSKEQTDFSIDLKDYALDSSKDDYKKERCTFTSAYGCLFVSSKAISPFYLRTAQAKAKQGEIPDVPSHCTVSCSVINYKKGRVGGDPNSYWELSLNDTVLAHYTLKDYYGKNISFDNDLYFLPCSTQIAKVWNNLPTNITKGIVATPKYSNAYPVRWGLNVDQAGVNGYWPSDYVYFKAPDGESVDGMKISLKYWGYGKVRSGGEYTSKKYEGYLEGGYRYKSQEELSLSIRDTKGVFDWLEVDSMPSKLSYAHLYNLLNQGWTTDNIAYFFTEMHKFPANNLATQYLKDSTTTKFKPTALLDCVFGNTPAAKGHFILDFFAQDRNTEANLETAMSNLATAAKTTVDAIIDKNVPNWNDPAKQVATIYPRVPYVTDTCAYAGRIFYLCGDTLLYSQMISEDVTKADCCYTDADPTSEELSDVIDTDGGTISLPEIGEGVKLAQLGAYLFVFGTRGTFVIAGTDNNIFTATAYTAGSLSAIPSQAPNSFVETEYGILYWGTTGIQLLSASNGIGVQDLSTDRILSFYGKLTNEQHKYCKGIYSASGKKVYWFYPSDPENAPRKLDMILVFDLIHSAFIPQAISDGRIIEGEYTTEDTPEIVSGLSLKVPFKGIKEYPITSLVEHPANYELKGTARIEDDLLSTVGEWVNIRPQGMIYTPEISSEMAVKITVSTIITPYNLNRASTILALYKRGETYTDYVDHGIARARIGISVNNALSMSYRRSAEDSWTHIEGWETNYILQVGKSYEIELELETEDILPASVSMILRVREVGEETWHIFSKLVRSTSIFDSPCTLCLAGETAGYFFGNWWFNGTIDLSKTSLLLDGARELLSLEEATIDNYEVVDDNGVKILADDPIESEEFSYESSILLCLDVANAKVTFGDFRSNLLRDWVAGDYQGVGYTFDSYLISHPMTCTHINQYGQRVSTTVTQKSLPNVITGFRRTETGKTTEGEYLYPSACQGSVLWNWATSGQFGKWDAPQEFYRPNKRTIFTDGYIFNRTNIRGLGRAYQLKLESVEDKQFILESISFNVQNDGRI